jgi:hypothetical protein
MTDKQITATYLDHMGSDLTVVNAARTETQRRILEAVSRGYKIKDGHLFGPKGKLNVAVYGKQRYPTFSTNWGCRVFGVPVHLFAAYVYYGEAAFKEGVVVRHLDGDVRNFSKDNLVLGTHSENNLDKPANVRKAAAVAARASQGFTPTNAKLSEDDVRRIRSFYKRLDGKKAKNGSVKALADELGVSRTVLQNIKNGGSYPNV